MTTFIKRLIRAVIPLCLRKRMAVWVDRLGCISAGRRAWWSVELIRDFAERDVNEYHKFLWAHHLAYAATYEVDERFGRENINVTRQMFLADLRELLADLKIDPVEDVKSVFDVGCSLGYLLRHLETEMFTSAVCLEGMDIDEYAIRTGAEYLERQGSKIKLGQADMEDLGSVMGDRSFDVIICTGVLMYLRADAAGHVVREMLYHTGRVLAITGLAHPEEDNSSLTQSVTRERDASLIHNIDSMVKAAGGEILARRWDGGKIIDGNTVYFIFASKPER